MKDGRAKAESGEYRDHDGDTYAATGFAEVLRNAVKGHDGNFTIFDVAFIDMVCDCFLRGIQLQHQTTTAIDALYGKFLALAKTNAGKTIRVADGSTFSIARHEAAGCVYMWMRSYGVPLNLLQCTCKAQP